MTGIPTVSDHFTFDSIFLFKILMIVWFVSVGIAKIVLAKDKADILKIRWVSNRC